MVVAGENERLKMLKGLRPHAVDRHIQLRAPHNRVEHQLAEIRVPPVREEMAASETEAAPAVRAFDRPADGKVIRLLGWSGDNDWFDPRIIFAKFEAVIVFLLRCERFHAAQHRMIRGAQLRFGLPGLNRRMPVVRRAAGFVIEITFDPFGDLVVKTNRVERGPVKENQAAPAFHLARDGLQVIANVERVMLFVAVGAI